MAAIDATNTTGASAGNNPNSIIYRPIGWNDLDAVVELFDRTWPQDGELAGTETSLLISRYFVLHYLQPTTFANAAFTVDGTGFGEEQSRQRNHVRRVGVVRRQSRRAWPRRGRRPVAPYAGAFRRMERGRVLPAHRFRLRCEFLRS